MNLNHITYVTIFFLLVACGAVSTASAAGRRNQTHVASGNFSRSFNVSAAARGSLSRRFRSAARSARTSSALSSATVARVRAAVSSRSLKIGRSRISNSGLQKLTRATAALKIQLKPANAHGNGSSGGLTHAPAATLQLRPPRSIARGPDRVAFAARQANVTPRLSSGSLQRVRQSLQSSNLPLGVSRVPRQALNSLSSAAERVRSHLHNKK